MHLIKRVEERGRLLRGFLSVSKSKKGGGLHDQYL